MTIILIVLMIIDIGIGLFNLLLSFAEHSHNKFVIENLMTVLDAMENDDAYLQSDIDHND